MSSVYITEPPTRGKVLLYTTFGEVEVELWAKEAPLACRNFVVLSQEGYYNNTMFHRVIKGFMLQGGDRSLSGGGNGGDCIYEGGGFPNEVHSRLRFSHRGLLGTASVTEDDAKDIRNNSQFFITLDRADWLDKKHTIFGRVVGNTIYNIVKMGDVPTDGADRPIGDKPASEWQRDDSIPKITKVEILWDPFEEDSWESFSKWRLVEKSQDANKEELKGEMATAEATRSKRRKELLSFADDDEEAEEEGVDGGFQGKAKRKMVSAHDVLVDDKRLSKEAVEVNEDGALGETTGITRTKQVLGTKKAGDENGDSEMSFDEKMRLKIMKKRMDVGDLPIKNELDEKEEGEIKKKSHHSEDDDEDEDQKEDRFKVGKLSMKRKGKGAGSGGKSKTVAVENSDLLTSSELRRKKIKQHKKSTAEREKATLARLQAFQSKLRTVRTTQQSSNRPESGGIKIDHAQSKDFGAEAPAEKTGNPTDAAVDDNEDEYGGDEGWQNHMLVFKANPHDRRKEMERRDNVDDYVVHDPLLAKGKGKWSAKEMNQKRKERREWGGSANMSRNLI